MTVQAAHSIRRRRAVARALVACGIGSVALAGCAVETPKANRRTTSATSTAHTARSATTAATATSAATTATTTPATTTTSTGPTRALCSTIPPEAAAALLEGPLSGQRPMPVEQPAGIVLIDGCTYQSGTALLRYAVVDTAGLGPTAAAGEVADFSRKVSAVKGTVEFDVGLPGAFGTVGPQGATQLAQIEFAKGTVLVQVDVVRPSAAGAQAAVLDVARRLNASLP